jgi:hypothetical protein
LRRFEKAVDFFDMDRNFAICTSAHGRRILEEVFQNQKILLICSCSLKI